MATLEYVAARHLSVMVDGEMVQLHPGDLIPNPEEWGRSLHANLEAGKILERISLGSFSDDELLAALELRGLHTSTIGMTTPVPDDARIFTVADADEIIDEGLVMVQKPSPVHLLQQADQFAVETNEGLMAGEPGGYVAHDVVSGHVWPVSAEYVAMHYDVPKAPRSPKGGK